jgi:DNA-binding NarL/FixJ family response regulator
MLHDFIAAPKSGKLRAALCSRYNDNIGRYPLPSHATLIIADDHPLFRAALTQTIVSGSQQPYNVVEAADISTLQDICQRESSVQLVLLDLHIPGAKGLSGLIYLVNNFPHIPVIMISANDSDDIIGRAISQGAAGFLSKSAEPAEIARAIDVVNSGDIYLPPHSQVDLDSLEDSEEHDISQLMSQLTPQQFKVAVMLAEGLLNKQIAYELNVTEATIKAHVTEIFRKLGVSSRTQAVLMISQLDIPAPSAH